MSDLYYVQASDGIRDQTLTVHSLEAAMLAMERVIDDGIATEVTVWHGDECVAEWYAFEPA